MANEAKPPRRDAGRETTFQLVVQGDGHRVSLLLNGTVELFRFDPFDMDMIGGADKLEQLLGRWLIKGVMGIDATAEDLCG